MHRSGLIFWSSLRFVCQDPTVHRYALSALSPLAYIPENGAQIIDAGGVSAVKNTLQYHSADPQVAISALSMINELAKHDGCKDSLVNAGIIPVLLSVMQGHAGNPHVQAQGLKCLATLCANSTSIQSGLYHAQGIPAILNAIRSAADTRATDAGTVELITEGVNLLAAIANNQECRPLIMQHGGIEITLQVMRFYIDFPVIQEMTWPCSVSSSCCYHVVTLPAVICICSCWYQLSRFYELLYLIKLDTYIDMFS